MKHLLALLLLAIATTALSACNTIKGVGQDVSATGRWVTGASNKVEHKIQN
jgi:predicted small secreted protein